MCGVSARGALNKYKQLAQTGIAFLHCRSNISRTVGNFQLGGAFADQEALTIESSLVSGCS